MKTGWSDPGDFPASKANQRDIIQHKDSSAIGDVAEGEVWHPNDGQYDTGSGGNGTTGGSDYLYANMRSGVKRIIQEGDKSFQQTVPLAAAPSNPVEGYVYFADGDATSGWDPLSFEGTSPYPVEYTGGIWMAAIDAQFSISNVDKNIIINGSLNFIERGTTWLLNAGDYQYCHDRWMAKVEGVTNVTYAHTVSSSPKPNEFNRHINIAYSGSAGGADCRITYEQRMLKYQVGSAAWRTASFWARAGSAGQRLAVSTRTYMGHDAPSPGSGPFQAPVAEITLTTDWERYVLAFQTPTWAANVEGDEGDAYGSLVFWAAGGADYVDQHGFTGGFYTPTTINVDISGVQFEYGQRATSFRRKDPNLEQAEVATYYRKYFGVGSGYVNSALAVGSVHLYVPLGVEFASKGTNQFVAHYPSIYVKGDQVNHPGPGQGGYAQLLWQTEDMRVIKVVGYDLSAYAKGDVVFNNSTTNWLSLENEYYEVSEPVSNTDPG